MKLLIQRVLSASVVIDDKLYSKINNGILVFIGIKETDSEKDIDYCIKKLLNIKIFSDNSDKFLKSIQETQSAILVVSQFTLYGSFKKGNKPSFSNAMQPKQAENLYNKFITKLKSSPLDIKTGLFGAYMKVSLENDGPVSFIIES